MNVALYDFICLKELETRQEQVYIYSYSYIQLYSIWSIYICVCVCVCIASVLGFPSSSTGKESTCNAGDLGLIPGLGRSPGEENGRLYYIFFFLSIFSVLFCFFHFFLLIQVTSQCYLTTPIQLIPFYLFYLIIIKYITCLYFILLTIMHIQFLQQLLSKKEKETYNDTVFVSTCIINFLGVFVYLFLMQL